MSFHVLKGIRWCIALIVLLTPALAFSHRHGHHCRSWSETDSACDFGCCWSGTNRLDVMTVSGTLERVTVLPRASFQTIEMKTDQGERLTVLLAPAWYLRDRQVELKIGDSVTVTCARLGGSEASRYAAIELVLQNGASVKLRDEAGFPLWQRGHAHCCDH